MLTSYTYRLRIMRMFLLVISLFAIWATIYVPSVLAAPTVQQSASSTYDLYVRRFSFLPAEPVVGEEITASIMVATKTYPSNGPFFPASHLRWRKGLRFAWHEIACPANYHYATCTPTITFSYNEPGWHIFEIQADSRNEVAETNETNNILYWPINVYPISPTPTLVP